MAESEVLKLRKELLHARETIEDLQEELRMTDEKCLKLQEEYSHNQDIVQQAREDLAKIDTIVEQKVAERIAQEQKDKEMLNDLLKEKNELIERLQEEQTKLVNREEMLTRDYNYLKGKMEETMGGNFEMQDALREVKRAQEEQKKKEDEIVSLVAQLNELSRQTEDLIAENRVLREMAGAPENIGIPINEIKLAEKEKLEEYKIKLRHYEEEIHSLEKERAILKARLRERPTIPGDKTFTKGLTGDQIILVEQFINDLREGKDPQYMGNEDLRRENEQLKAEIERLKKSNPGDIEKIVEKVMMRRSQSKVPENNEAGLLEKIQKENADLLKTIREMMATGNIPRSTIMERTLKPGNSGDQAEIEKQLSRHMYPPEPIKKADGSIETGKSYRFIGAPMQIVPFDMNRYKGDKITKEEFAFLQLALIEAIELNTRKDNELKGYSGDFSKTESKIRSFILQRNELYKDYAKASAQWKEEEKGLKEQNLELTDLLRAEKIKNTDLEKLLSTLQKGIKDTDTAAKLIDLTKKSSILEVSMMQLTRKYLTLQEEYRLIHTQYTNIEKTNKERELLLEERILKLKEWKSKATLELKYLYNKLRASVSLVKYETQKRKLDALQEKEMQWLEATQELMIIKSDRAAADRERAELEENLQESKAMLTDAEQEIQLIGGRLKRKDNEYAFERAVFDKMIDSFKMYRMSPQEAFEVFDKNHSGSISKEEFRSILSQLKLEVSSNDLDAIMKFMDVDSTGSIRYKSFVRTLKRYGIKSRTKEDEVIARIAETIGKTGTDLGKAFEVIDRDGDSLINKQEMLDALLAMHLGIKEEELVNAINYIYPEGAQGIDYRRFCRVFEKTLQNISREEKQTKESWKYEIFRKIDSRLLDNKVSLHNAFETTKEGNVTKDEFAKVCLKLGVSVSPQELAEIYADFDNKGTGQAPFAEIAVAIIQSKSGRAVGSGTRSERMAEYDMKGYGEESDIEGLKTKIMILQEREKIALEKVKRENDQVKLLQELVKKRTEECENKEKQYRQLTDKHFKLQESATMLESKLANCISKQESAEIKLKYENNERDLLDKDAAMQTYKGMYEAIVQQMRSLELSFGRRKDESTELHKALLEIQSNNDKDNLIGKLYYVILLSRWQEGATNRKYDTAITDMKRQKTALYTTEAELAKKEDEVAKLETRLQDTAELLSELSEKAKEKESVEYIREKFVEVTSKMKDLIKTKIDTEMDNIKLREENTKLSYLTDQLELEKKQAQELAEVLRYKNDSEIGRKFAELSDKLSTLKLSELRAERDAKMSKEKEIYLERVNSQNLVQIKRLEEELGNITSTLQKTEELFREKDKERERLFFELKQAKKVTQEEPARITDTIIKEDKKKQTNNEILQNTQPTSGNSELIALLKEKDGVISALRNELTMLRGSAGNQSTSEVHKADYELLRDQEKKQMADVAYKTIKTLETIINNQKEQLKRKDEFIKQIREESTKEREENLNEITKLQKELAGETQRAMGKLISMGKESSIRPPAVYTDATIRGLGEVDTAITVKDGKIKELASKLELYISEIKTKDKEIGLLRSQNMELEAKISKIDKEERLSSVRQELERTKKELARKNADYKGLKETIEKLRKEFDTYSEKNIKQTQDINSLASKEKQYDHDKQLLKQQVTNAQNELQNHAKILAKAQEALRESQIKESELKMQVEQLKQELEKAKNLHGNLQRELISVNEKKQKPEKIEPRPMTSTMAPPKENVEIQNLKKENEKLKQELVTYKFKENVDENLKINIERSVIESKKITEISKISYIDEIIEQSKSLINPKINPLEIFEAYSGEQDIVPEAEFFQICEKIGLIFADVSKTEILQKCKSLKREGYCDFYEFAHALKGIIYKRFIDQELLKFGKIVIDEGIGNAQILKAFYEEQTGTISGISKATVEKGLLGLFNAEGTSGEVEYILKRAKLNETEGRYSLEKIVQLLNKASKTYLVDSIRESLSRFDPIMMFLEQDSNSDNKLTLSEFSNLLSNVSIKPSPATLDLICEIFDPTHSELISLEIFCQALVIHCDQNIAKNIEEAKIKSDMSIVSKRAAKLLINVVGGNEQKLMEIFAEQDYQLCGLTSIPGALNTIIKQFGKEVKKADISMLLKDLEIPNNKGLFCYHSLAHRIYELAQINSTHSAILKRILSVATRKGAPLNNPSGFKQLFTNADKDGKITFERFRIHLQSIISGLSKEELQILENAYCPKDAPKKVLDLKIFCDELFSPDLRKTQLVQPNFEQTKLQHSLKQTSKKDTIIQKEPEKSYMSGFGNTATQMQQVAFKGKLEDLKKDNENLKRENYALSQRISMLESSEKSGLKQEFGLMKSEVNQSKTIDTKPKIDTNTTKQYSAKITELESTNYELMKKIDTEYKPNIAKYRQEIEKLKADIKFLKLDNLKFESQIEKMLKKNMDGVEKKHELEFIKDTKIAEQQKKITDLSAEVQKLEEKIFGLEQTKLELQFEKENFDLERSRLERRIKDLEQFQAESGK